MRDDSPKGKSFSVIWINCRAVEEDKAFGDSGSIHELRRCYPQHSEAQAQGIKNISVSILVNIFAVKDDGCHATVIDPQEVKDIGHSEITGAFRTLNRSNEASVLDPEGGRTNCLPVLGSSQQVRQRGPGIQVSQRSCIRMDESRGRISHPP